VTLYGNGRLARVDPQSLRTIKEYTLPGGADGGPYAVTIDADGKVFVNEFNADTVVMLEPRTGAMRTLALPKNTGIRKMTVDRNGALWYVGSTSGRLGRIE
jgi:virginiamycin B lyase